MQNVPLVLVLDHETCALTLSAPGYFCLIMPRGEAHSAPSVNPGRKILLTTVILCIVTKQSFVEKSQVEKSFQNCSYRDDNVTNYVSFFENLCKKWQKCFFFLKLTL